MRPYGILLGHKDLKGQLLQAYGAVLNFSVTKSLTDLQGWFLEGHAPLKNYETYNNERKETSFCK